MSSPIKWWRKIGQPILGQKLARQPHSGSAVRREPSRCGRHRYRCYRQLKGFIQAVEKPYGKASGEQPANKYFDGVFMGRSEVASRGYYKVVWVTIKDDKIVDFKAQRVLADGTIQDPAEYGWPLEMARESYKNAALESEPGYVDIISGATGLTEMSNIAVRDALDRASPDKSPTSPKKHLTPRQVLFPFPFRSPRCCSLYPHRSLRL